MNKLDYNPIIETYIRTYKTQLYAFEHCYGDKIMACPELKAFREVILSIRKIQDTQNDKLNYINFCDD